MQPLTDHNHSLGPLRLIAPALQRHAHHPLSALHLEAKRRRQAAGRRSQPRGIGNPPESGVRQTDVRACVKSDCRFKSDCRVLLQSLSSKICSHSRKCAVFAAPDHQSGRRHCDLPPALRQFCSHQSAQRYDLSSLSHALSPLYAHVLKACPCRTNSRCGCSRGTAANRSPEIQG